IGEITRLSAEETKKLFPALSEEYSSVHISGAARVNGRLLRNALISAAKKHGATFIKGDAVLVHEGNHIMGVKVNDETILAEKV
ncbi:FAD-binding oxidoreductase, partial [Escherichia coli]|nr:FAD-binding oxidoreductase [Escherichia coli]